MSDEPVSAALPISPVEPAERYPFWGYRDLAFLGGLMVPALLAAAMIVNLLALILPGLAQSQAALVLAIQFLGYGLWFLCLYGLLRVRYRRPFWESMAWTHPRAGITAVALGGAVLAVSVGVLGALLRTPDIEMPMKELLRDRSSILLIGVFAVTLGPLCEELVFRGFLLPLVARNLGSIAGVVLTASVFSVLHGPQYAWSWQHLALITLAGAAFGWIRLHTGSTAAAAVAHAAYNLTFLIGFISKWEELPAQW